MTSVPTEATRQPVLEVREACFGYGHQSVVKHFSLEVFPGEVVAVAGVNGAGKSTVIKSLLGILPVQTGTVRVFGLSPSQPEARQHVGFLPEVATPPVFLSCREYLCHCLRFYQSDPQKRKARVEEVLEQVGLKDKGSVRVSRLSKGMRQRLNIAQAVAHRPALVILDEPASGLDPYGRDMLFALIKQLAAGGTAVVFSSHHLGDAASVASRICILDGGRVLFNGPVPPDEALGAFFRRTVDLGTSHPVSSSSLSDTRAGGLLPFGASVSEVRSLCAVIRLGFLESWRRKEYLVAVLLSMVLLYVASSVSMMNVPAAGSFSLQAAFFAAWVFTLTAAILTGERLVADEKRRHTLELLMSRPISPLGLIAGKCVGGMAGLLLLLLPLYALVWAFAILFLEQTLQVVPLLQALFMHWIGLSFPLMLGCVLSLYLTRSTAILIACILTFPMWSYDSYFSRLSTETGIPWLPVLDLCYPNLGIFDYSSGVIFSWGSVAILTILFVGMYAVFFSGLLFVISARNFNRLVIKEDVDV